MGRILILSLSLLLVSLFPFSLSSQTTNHETQAFIIRVQNDMKPTIFSTVEQWYSTTLRSLTSTPLDSQKENNSKDFLHVYKTVFHGFSTKLTLQQVEEIKTRPGVLGVYPDRVRQIHTTRSPQFLGLTLQGPENILDESDYGSNIIVGVLDTGIWPERHSFHDQGLDAVPSHWKGECTEGKNFTKNLCNKKLIGARYFFEGYQAKYGVINDTTEFKSPRDSEGHGTHTASTVAGRQVKQASLFGYAAGVAVGIAPKARIAVYKICWENGCADSDILAGFDKAVEDGVDVISLSVGSGPLPYDIDPIAIGAFGAMERGIFISASGGNEGPGEKTVSNIAPWITTVGAGTIDRSFPADVILEDGPVIVGTSLFSGTPLQNGKFFPIVYAGNVSTAASSGGAGGGGFYGAICMPKMLDPKLVRGKIVLCDRGGVPRALKGFAVKEAGGVGMILANVHPQGEGLIADSHVLPAVAITESGGYTVHSYVASSKNPRARFVFHGTKLNVKPAPMVAAFSSRGPNSESPYLIKPDLIAPGVHILAAWVDGVGPTSLPSDKRRTEFNILCGTSMSCPHVSGLAALLKGVHQDWSPMMIRSALMTTAYVHDREGKPLLDECSRNASTVWDMGSGHVDPQKATDPGLVFYLTVDDYLDFLCASNYSSANIRKITKKPVKCTKKGLNPWDLNYPSISVVFDQSSGSEFEITVTRTMMQVSEGTSSYTVKIDNPKGVVVTVEPSKLDFSQMKQKQSFVAKISARKVDMPGVKSKSELGRMTWSDGKHVVNMPIAVTWNQPF